MQALIKKCHETFQTALFFIKFYNSFQYPLLLLSIKLRKAKDQKKSVPAGRFSILLQEGWREFPRALHRCIGRSGLGR